MDSTLEHVDGEQPSQNGDVMPSMHTIPPRTKTKIKRTTLSLHEKVIVKTFCEQQLNDCKNRADYVPSHDVLRQEIVAKFGWEVGRSTLSKIMSMEWDQLQLQGHPNPTMKRKRKPLFPAFEDDLIKSIQAFTQQAHLSADDEDGNKGAPILTEAIILEEAQRLKQLHGIKDEELVLSVGWLARFKHRNGIRLRKSTGTRGDVPLNNSGGSEAIVSDQDLAKKRMRTAGFGTNYDFAFHLQANPGLSIRHIVPHIEQGILLTSAFTNLRSACIARSTLESGVQEGAACVPTSILDALPSDIRSYCCPHCPISMPVDILGLHVTIVGYNSVRDAFVAASRVGQNGSVTCVEANDEAATIGEQHGVAYTTKALGYLISNLHIVRPPHVGDTHVMGGRDFVQFNCSFQTSVHKTQLIEWAFNVLQEGGECRVKFASSTRRITQLPATQQATGVDTQPPASTNELVAASIYVEDFRRMCQHLGFLDPRCLHLSPVEGSSENGLAVATYRLFKLRLVEDRREDYGERATYTGDDASFRLDSQWVFLPTRSVPVDGNTAQILRLSWLKHLFTVDGGRSVHRGRFIDGRSHPVDC